jgi:hypothetical protein
MNVKRILCLSGQIILAKVWENGKNMSRVHKKSCDVRCYMFELAGRYWVTSLLWHQSFRRIVFRRSSTSARKGNIKLPPGSRNTIMMGTIFDICLRWDLISFISSFVHFSPVFLFFMRSCIRPLTARTWLKIKSLFFISNFFKYLLIIRLSPGNHIYPTLPVRARAQPQNKSRSGKK